MKKDAISRDMPDWSYAFIQREGIEIDPTNEYLEGVYSVTALHRDESPLNTAFMVMLDGRKRFWLMPPETIVGERDAENPLFVSSSALLKYTYKGLLMAQIEAGDLLVFPGHWFHEVHNLSPNSFAITNAGVWPKAKN
jgi:hypothetical protein